MGKRWMAVPLGTVAMLLAPAVSGAAAWHGNEGTRAASAEATQGREPDVQAWALALGAFAFFGTVLRSVKDR